MLPFLPPLLTLLNFFFQKYIQNAQIVVNFFQTLSPLFLCVHMCVLYATKKKEEYDDKGKMIFSHLLHSLTNQQ